MRFWFERFAELAILLSGIGLFLSTLIAFGEVHPLAAKRRVS
tara:strand:+ start:21 stop:146 length:126 start_codon:yes stop_codon:yes gene_type:complete